MLPLVPDPGAKLAALVRGEGAFSSSEQNGVELVWTYLDEPVVGPQQSLRMNLIFRSLVDEDREVIPEFIAPEGFKAATRMAPFLLRARAEQAFPVVLQSPPGGVHERVFARVKAGTAEYRTPILPAQLWHLVGPFVNHEGTGFERSYPAESNIRAGQIYNGRSDLAVRWEGRWFSGTSFDLEADFKSGPGVALLWARVRLPGAGRYRLFCASSVGVVCTVDGMKVLAYHDEHQPDLHDKARYSGSFSSTGDSVVLIKVLRNKKPLQPLVISFFTEDGQVVYPLAFLPMD
jgi:hypothetical protein